MAGVEFKTTVFTAVNAQRLVQVLLMVLGVVYLVQLGKVGWEEGKGGRKVVLCKALLMVLDVAYLMQLRKRREEGMRKAMDFNFYSSITSPHIHIKSGALRHELERLSAVTTGVKK